MSGAVTRGRRSHLTSRVNGERKMQYGCWTDWSGGWTYGYATSDSFGYTLGGSSVWPA